MNLKVRIPDDQAQTLRAEAERLDRTISYLVRLAIREWIARQPTERKGAA